MERLSLRGLHRPVLPRPQGPSPQREDMISTRSQNCSSQHRHRTYPTLWYFGPCEYLGTRSNGNLHMYLYVEGPFNKNLQVRSAKGNLHFTYDSLVVEACSVAGPDDVRWPFRILHIVAACLQAQPARALKPEKSISDPNKVLFKGPCRRPNLSWRVQARPQNKKYFAQS